MSAPKKIKIEEEKTSVSGYVQNVSPIRTSRTNSRYFNAIFQTERNEFNRAACFDVAKHSVLMDASQAHTPLKLLDVQLVPSRIDASKSEVLLNHKTKIEVCRTLNFNFKQSPNDDDKDGEKVKSLAEVQATPEHNKSYTKPDGLISAQFPPDCYAESLFRLLKDFEAQILVALSPLTDMESVYTNSFLPQAQSSTTVGPFTLTHKSSSKSNDISKCNLVVKKKGSKEMHILEVFECLAWQATDWMSDPRNMVDLVKEVKMSQYARPNTSIVVLSSDGATRTGVFCTVFNALEELTNDNDVDIFTIARQLQIRRPEFLPDFMEYRFCYEVVYEYLKNDMVYANC